MRRLSSLYLILFYVRFVVSNSLTTPRPNRTEAKEVLDKILELKETLNEIASPYLKVVVRGVSQNCVQMQCKIICFNGKSEDIENDIKAINKSINNNCEVIEELRLYNYEFPNSIIPRKFLGNYTDKIKQLYLGNSNVTDYEDGAFGNGIFQKIELENLKLIRLRKGFFKDVNQQYIQSLSVIQRETPLVSICENTFADVKYVIKYLTLQVGIPCIRNITASNVLFNNLAYVDFSYNSLGSNLDSDAFEMLSRVEHLDLSHSSIHFLPEYIFHKMECLEFLDLSNNHLTTITANIFGWIEMPSELKIYADNNDWFCTCELKQQMKVIFGKYLAYIYCKSPAQFAGWSIFDHRICDEDVFQAKKAKKSTALPWTASNDNANAPMESAGSPFVTSVGMPTSTLSQINPTSNSFMDLKCKRQSGLEFFDLKVKPPSIDFTVNTKPNLSVDVVLKVPELLGDSYGLIWFSKVTKEYYKMEVNYNEYGFGCFGSISYSTTVNNLRPRVSYTFCVILHSQVTVSPFNCKSTHMPGNLDVRYNAWLTRDSRVTGISLFILGIVFFTFIGIFAIFIILKNKPTLLKGSKRVATTKGNLNEIVVLPKERTLEDLRHKEEMLAKRNSKGNINALPQRRRSTDSSVSYQSYMNANIYEELPAYLKVDRNLSRNNSAEEEKDHSYNYIPPLSEDCSSKSHLVSYAEIPSRHKRNSKDPLPEVPKGEIDTAAQKNFSQKFLIIERKDLDLSTAHFAFIHDCSV